MTVIVQTPEAPAPDSADEVITQWLREVLGSLDYANFRPTMDGNVTVCGTLFHYRVGLFMGCVSEAIIAAKQFVKINQVRDGREHYWAKDQLKVIDPLKPQDCMYYSYSADGIRWEPPPDYSTQASGPLGQGLGNSLLGPPSSPSAHQYQQAMLAAQAKLKHVQIQAAQAQAKASPQAPSWFQKWLTP